MAEIVKKKWFIALMVILGIAVVAGLTVLIIWLVQNSKSDYETIILEGDGVGDVPQSFAYTRLRRGAHTFWWYYPTTHHSARENENNRPIIVWLDGLLGLPPSLLANFGMFGPYDFDLKRREDSWINDFNLLFVDAPVGTGFSFFNKDDQVAKTPEQITEDLYFTLRSFYSANEGLENNTLYIIGQGYGGKQAVALATKLHEVLNEEELENSNNSTREFQFNLEGIVLGNAIISPAQVLSKLGFYLEEWAYIDGEGRPLVEEYASNTLALVNDGKLSEAFDNFLGLGEFINDKAGAIAVNLQHIVDRLTRQPNTKGNFGQAKQLQSRINNLNLNKFMDETVGPKLGVSSRVSFDQLHDKALDATRDIFMQCDIEKVENLLEKTDIKIYIYNGNLDAVSNTPGQLDWINQLKWSNQSEFLSSPRRLIAIDGILEGHVRQSERLHFYWMNAAGQSVPLDSPAAMREVLRRITGF